MSDVRIGRAARALRHRLGWTQRELAAKAGVSRPVISLVERGRIERLSLPALRRIVKALDADLVLFVRWRGGDPRPPSRRITLGWSISGNSRRPTWQSEATREARGDELGVHRPDARH